MPGPDAFRLPRTVEPVRYELTITPDVQSSTFSGEERIRLRVAEPVDRIVLNAAELAVTAAELVPAAGGPGTGQRVLVAHDDAAERVTLSPNEPLGPGTWDLLLRFDGRLNDKLRGFYRSTFRDQEGNEQVIAATQFEPADARRAFPWCPTAGSWPRRCDRTGGGASPSRTPCRCPPTWWRSWWGRSRPQRPPTSTACPSGSSTSPARST